MKYKLLFLLLFIVNMAYSKDRWSVETIFIEPVETNNYAYTVDSLTFEILPSFYGGGNKGAIYFDVLNNSSNRIYIEWENARLEDSQIVFSDDRMLEINKPKQEEVVMSGEQSISKELIPRRYVFSNSPIGPLWEKSLLKKGYNQTASLIIPIRKANKKTKDYKFKIKFVYKE